MKVLGFFLAALLGVMSLAAAAAVGLYAYIAPDLPSTAALRDVQLQVPLRVYSSDQRLIAEFGEKRRLPVAIDSVPDVMINAFLAAEDDRFFQHPGVDYQGLLRAAVELIRTGEKRQGGSTITMQVARNYFLSSEKTYLRKLTEILLALKIERELSKRAILELYLNKIYLGQRAYGVGAAAYVYYGTTLDRLTTAQAAMIAGLPKAPSLYNPVTNRMRATIRRDYVLRRMHDLGHLDAEALKSAIDEVDQSRLHASPVELEAPYVAEMVRADVVGRYGDEAYVRGLNAYTTLHSRHQQAANEALRAGLIEYDRRHGYRGPERHLVLENPADAVDVAAKLRDTSAFGGLLPGIVVLVEEKACYVVLRDGSRVEVPWEGMNWARRYINPNRREPPLKSAGDVVSVGDQVRVQRDGDVWRLAQLPAVEGALVGLDPADGAIRALVGGFDFYRSKFNRAVQANRQPGSSFKPFIYSAALEKGFTTASVLNDAPVVFDDTSLEQAWRPENYSGRFYGPTRLREALVHSRNLVSIRLLQAIGVHYARDYVRRFGFRDASVPPELSLALGSGTLTPLEITRGFAAFANGGYLIEPYFLDRIVDAHGGVLHEAAPPRVCAECGDPAPGSPAEMADGHPGASPAHAVITPQNAWLMTSMMQDVIRRGTAQRARSLGRSDLAGKTGTTNDQRDAWFCGYTQGLVAGVWVGFDEVAPLGTNETGGYAALPIWMQYLGAVLDTIPPARWDPPEGLVTVRIDPQNGLLAGADQPNAVFEVFRAGEVPERSSTATAPGDGNGSTGLPDQLF